MSHSDYAPIVAVEELRVHFPTGRRGEVVHAVDGVSFTVHEGETFGVIGESGSGKSTLARALVCLTRPTAGHVLHRGIDPFALPATELRTHRRQFQIVFQDPNAALDPRMSLGDSIREPLELAKVGDPAARRRRMLELLDLVGLDSGIARRYPHEISGGQKQRVNIARALALQPAVIVCDEVVAALDASIQADILNLFADLQRQFRLTYVFITHDIGVVSHVSDRIAVMYLGWVVELGPAREVTEAPLHPYTQALLAAEPVPLPTTLRPPKQARLAGEVPSPISPPAGCRFHGRCPHANAHCMTEIPMFRKVARDRWVACHYVTTESASLRDSEVAVAAGARQRNESLRQQEKRNVIK